MPEVIYPSRTRCKKCRKGLENTAVVDGIYCSYRCASIPTPSSKVDEAPRGCKRQINGTWGFKTRYKYEGAVPQRLRDDPATNIYKCDYCHNLHVGHNAVIASSEAKLHRGVTSLQQMGSVIQRHRESCKITKKQVANKLKIPIIRVTEIEEGRKEARAGVLFAIASELRLSIEVKSS